MADPSHDDAGPPRILTARRVGIWLGITLFLWIVAVGYLLNDARVHAEAGEDSLRTVADVVDSENLAEVDLGSVEQELIVGVRELSEASTSIDNPLLKPLGVVPVVGRHVASVRSLIHASRDLAIVITPVVSSARRAQDAPGDLDRVAFLAEVSEQLDEVHAVATTLDLGPSENLVSILADGRAEFDEQLADLIDSVEQYRAVTRGVGSFLDDSTVLVLGANNAEMMAGTGMHLSIGRLEVVDGEFELPGLEPANEMFPIRGAELVDDDIERMWGSILPQNDYRKLGLTARFDTYMGPQGLEMWRAQTGEELDAVVALDPFVLDALLNVVGEVEIEGQTFTAGQALSYLLQDQYLEFDGRVDERKDRLSQIASGVVVALGESDWDPIELVDALRPLARGRHIMLYSSDPEEQAAWRQLGVDGRLEGAQSGVYLMNHGGSKLDPFVNVDVAASSTVHGDVRRVRYEVDITNGAPATGLPAYTVGPWEQIGLPTPGTYTGQMAVNVPSTATTVEFLPSSATVLSGPDGEVGYAAGPRFELEPGQTKRFIVVYELPASVAEVEVVSSARFPAAAWDWDGVRFTDVVARSIELG